jgi:hypothetical protein
MDIRLLPHQDPLARVIGGYSHPVLPGATLARILGEATLEPQGLRLVL